MTETPTQTPAPRRRAGLLATVAVLCVGLGGAAVLVIQSELPKGGRPASLGVQPPLTMREEAAASPSSNEARPVVVAAENFREIRDRLDRLNTVQQAPQDQRAPVDPQVEVLKTMVGELEQLFLVGLDAQARQRDEMTQRIALVEAEVGAHTTSLQYRIEAVSRRVGLVAPDHPSHATIAAAPKPPEPEPIAAPRPPAVARPAAQPSNPAPRPPTSSAAAYQVTDGSSDHALLAVRRPAPGQAPNILARVGTELPGIGKVVRIERRGNAWEVHAERGVVTQ